MRWPLLTSHLPYNEKLSLLRQKLCDPNILQTFKYWKQVAFLTGLPLRLTHLFTVFFFLKQTTTHIYNYKGYYTIRLINQLPAGAFAFLISIMQLIYFLFLALFHWGDDARRVLATCWWHMCKICHFLLLITTKEGGLTVISALTFQKMFMQREKGRRGRGRAEG